MAGFSLSYGKSRKCSSLNSPILLKKYSRSKKSRAEALGWDGWKKESFEANQSLKNPVQCTKQGNDSMKDMTGSGLYFMPFENEVVSKQQSLHLFANETLLMSDSFLIPLPNLSSGGLLESNSSYISTNKAIFTVLIPSSQILVVNSAACQLLNYNSNELCGLKLENCIKESHKHKWLALQDDFLENPDKVLIKSGKLLELVGKNGSTVLVSLFLKKIDNPQRCLVIAEPFDRRTGSISVDANGKILSYDEESEMIFQYDASEMVGLDIHVLLPAISLSKNDDLIYKKSFKQNITGRTKKNEAFPVSVSVSQRNPSLETFEIMIRVYVGLNGLILLNKRLLITNFNHYFIKFLFGFSKREIIGHSIMNLIPTLCTDVRSEIRRESLNEISKSLNNAHLSSCLPKSEGCQEISFGGSFCRSNCSNNKKSSITFLSPNSDSCCSKVFDNCLDQDMSLENCSSFKISHVPKELQEVASKNGADEKIQSEGFSKSELKVVSQIIKTKESSCNTDENKDEGNLNENFKVKEGKYFGLGKHSDGTYIGIEYQIKIVELSDDVFYCIWLTRDLLNVSNFEKNTMENVKADSSLNSASCESCLPNSSGCSEHFERHTSTSIISQCDELLTAGEYCEYYTNIKQIGKGAFGYVKMAFRDLDGLLVVTKFIKKQKINVRSWVFDSNLNMKIPLEISLLATLEHPNIVRVLDVFHNDSFFQLVMEKHGAGFDLFEFIDRRPKCDEKLKSYIFRQIISAVHYLDSLGILHRDIKDENVIINEKFEIKLIDFGSATFMSPNETFSKFYGTVEYCSPEVLQGNSYKGPELEIWALGVTLYVLTFGENPFYGIEETIKGHFSIPSPLSSELNDLLHKMLDKNVETRITIDKVVDDPWINQPVCIENYRFEEVVRCYEEEANPPKYIYEIHSQEPYFIPDSKNDSSKMMDEKNFSNNLQNGSIDEFGDFDNIQVADEISGENVTGKENSTSVIVSSTPVSKKNKGMWNSDIGQWNHLGNCVPLKDLSYEYSNSNINSNELNVKLKILKKRNNGSLCFVGLSNSKERVPVFDDGDNSELHLEESYLLGENVPEVEKYSSNNDDDVVLQSTSKKAVEMDFMKKYLLTKEK